MSNYLIQNLLHHFIISDYHPFTAEKGSEPSRHRFVPVDLKRSEKFCYVCGGRVNPYFW